VFPTLLYIAAIYYKSSKDLLLVIAIGYEYTARIRYIVGGEDAKKETGFYAIINSALATAVVVGNLIG